MTRRLGMYVVFAALVAAFLMLVGELPAGTKSDVPCDVMTTLELRSALKAEREENFALKKQIKALEQDIEILAQGHISNWVRDGQFDFAVFGNTECYLLVNAVMIENECTGFAIYTEALRDELGLESRGEVDYEEENGNGRE